MAKLILVRHGESTWNKENRFTGWTDVPLTKRGKKQAQQGGAALTAANIPIHSIFTSYLTRAKQTLTEMHLATPATVTSAWQLNERHYGALQGLNKQETAQTHGEEQVLLWRRSYDVPPPALSDDDDRHPRNDPLYEHVQPELLPATECLKDTVMRAWPYYKEYIKPLLQEGNNVLIVAHGNSLRALIKQLETISDEDILAVNVPYAIPIVYDIKQDVVEKKEFLADEQTLKKLEEEVKNQGKA